MKIRILITIVFLSAISLSSCKSIELRDKHKEKSNKTVPPGQLKKTTGSQSATPFAPGQYP